MWAGGSDKVDTQNCAGGHKSVPREFWSRSSNYFVQSMALYGFVSAAGFCLIQTVEYVQSYSK